MPPSAGCDTWKREKKGLIKGLTKRLSSETGKLRNGEAQKRGNSETGKPNPSANTHIIPKRQLKGSETGMDTKQMGSPN